MSIRIPRQERIKIYFDCICGIICSGLAISGIIITTFLKGIFNPVMYTLGLTFWIIWLCMSIVLILIGLYTKKKEEEYLRNLLSETGT